MVIFILFPFFHNACPLLGQMNAAVE